MYISPWMQAAILPQRFDVCGLILPPLSLWHVYILRTSGNPYFCPDKRGDMDAATEVLIYAQGGIDHGRRLYLSPHYRERVRRKLHRKLRRMDWQDVDAAVFEYVFECTRTPGHKQAVQSGAGKNAVKSRKVAAPYEWVLAEYLAGGRVDKITAAFDAPYSLACCMFDARRDVRGEDESLIDEAAEKRIDEKLERWRNEAAGVK